MEAIINFDIEGLQHLKMLLLENKSKLCEMVERMADPALAIVDKEHMLGVCEKHYMAFTGPGGSSSDISFFGDQGSLDDGAATDSSDYGI